MNGTKLIRDDGITGLNIRDIGILRDNITEIDFSKIKINSKTEWYDGGDEKDEAEPSDEMIEARGDRVGAELEDKGEHNHKEE
jgi:hypothetical protein